MAATTKKKQKKKNKKTSRGAEAPAVKKAASAKKKPTAPTDLRAEIARYSARNGYVAEQHADVVCACGGVAFAVQVDDSAGAAIRTCPKCGAEHPIGDSDEYLDDAELEECECPCGNPTFHITVSVSLYDGSEDVRWLYLGCRCTACGLAAVYADWKNEFNGFRDLLAKV